MPDHLYLLLKIEDNPYRRPLGTFVFNLGRALSRAYWEAQGGSETAPQNNDGAATAESPSVRAASVPPVFEHDWHDWIVMKRGQLSAFTRYILENPRRAWLRRENRRFFSRPGKLAFAGRDWFAYGNPALLELPVLEPFRCSRAWAADGPEWREAPAPATTTTCSWLPKICRSRRNALPKPFTPPSPIAAPAPASETSPPVSKNSRAALPARKRCQPSSPRDSRPRAAARLPPARLPLRPPLPLRRPRVRRSHAGALPAP